MAFSRQLGVVGILSACFFVAVGCGDDDDKKDTGGEAGEGGESGSSTAGSGGKAAGGSSSGNAGKAGASAAGTGNDGGAAGDTGGGGGGAPLGGMAGEGGTAGAAAGAGGEGGMAGPTFTQCAASCAVDADCIIEGNETNKCDPATHLCVDPATRCEAHQDCEPLFTFFPFFACEDSEGCGPGERCVEHQGAGYCVAGPDPELGCASGVARTLPVFGDEGTAVVCMTNDGRCLDGGVCELGCGAQGGCPDGGTCDEASGVCGCNSGEDCDIGVCGPDGQCAECVTNGDCAKAENDGGNKECIAGKCGCASAETCPNYGWDNATPVCE